MFILIFFLFASFSFLLEFFSHVFRLKFCWKSRVRERVENFPEVVILRWENSCWIFLRRVLGEDFRKFPSPEGFWVEISSLGSSGEDFRNSCETLAVEKYLPNRSMSFACKIFSMGFLSSSISLLHQLGTSSWNILVHRILKFSGR